MNYYELTHKELIKLLQQKDEEIAELESKLYLSKRRTKETEKTVIDICKANYKSVVISTTNKETERLQNKGYELLCYTNDIDILHKLTDYRPAFIGLFLGVIIFLMGWITIKFQI